MSPLDSRIRPTAELVRGAIGDILGDTLRGARVLDLFAGTGAIGLEAISRGAQWADFVEISRGGLHALRANIASLRLIRRTRVFGRDALPFADALAPDRYSIAFADPPYSSRMLDRLIESWQRTRWARVLVVEHATSHRIPAGRECHVLEDTSLTIYDASRPG